VHLEKVGPDRARDHHALFGIESGSGRGGGGKRAEDEERECRARQGIPAQQQRHCVEERRAEQKSDREMDRQRMDILEVFHPREKSPQHRFT
jgi:imidazolonepropionase-like amidohydrolase